MKIAGWQKVSMVDYPGKIATVLFTPAATSTVIIATTEN